MKFITKQFLSIIITCISLVFIESCVTQHGDNSFSGNQSTYIDSTHEVIRTSSATYTLNEGSSGSTITGEGLTFTFNANWYGNGETQTGTVGSDKEEVIATLSNNKSSLHMQWGAANVTTMFDGTR
jgi:hypothetical protein